MLLEVEGGLGVLLWQTVRDVTLWAATPTEDRERLFTERARSGRVAALAASRLEDGVARPLGTLAGLLGDPQRVRAEEVAEACGELARWAEERGALGTALAFAQAVALALPGSAPAAQAVGLLARRRAELARAETWFRRAVMLARQTGDWSSYALAFCSLGKLYIHRGNFPTARKLLVRSRRSARRHGLRALEAAALHELFVIAASAMDTGEAESFAAAALEAYGARHPGLPRLAHDVAYFWLENGHFSRALPVFQAVRPHLARPREQARVTADIARAAAGTGERAIFEESWARAMELVRQLEADEGSAQALVDLAHGAAMLGDWERAEEAATRALEKARQRTEGKLRLVAESLLESVHHGRLADRRPSPSEAEPTRGDALAAELVESLGAPAAGKAVAGADSGAFGYYGYVEARYEAGG